MNWKPSKIFYGWWIVSAVFLIWLIHGGFVSLGFTAFFEPIVNEFGWSYTQVSFAASLGGMESGILAPLIGLVVDRWGPRRLMFAGIVIICIGLILLGHTASLAMLYSAFALIAIGSSGCSPTVGMTAVANWFRGKIGIATGIISSGFALGGLLIPVLVGLIDISGWRSSTFILSLIILLTCLPLSLLVRHKPEQYGYLPDGEQINNITTDNKPAPAHIIEVDTEARQALKSRAFWQIGLAMVFQFTAASAVTVHVMPCLSSVGIPRLTSSLVAMSIPLISITGRLGAGWLTGTLANKRIAAGCSAVASLGLLFFSYSSSKMIWLLIPFIILFGVSWGGYSTIRVALVREYFGRRRFGTIFGFIMTLNALASIIGPLFAGWVFDTWASYNAAWLTFACLNLVGLIIMVTLQPVSNNV